jgi:hypothetical protein
MTAREFVKWALEDVFEDYNFKEALQVLSQYMGKNADFYLQFPDYVVKDEDDVPISEHIDEPANFQEYFEEKRD